MARTLDEIEAELDRATWGSKKFSGAAVRRLHEEYRDALIEALGMEPEVKTSAGERYAATTGEFRRWFREDREKKAAHG